MDDDNDDELFLPPADAYLCGLPNDPKIQLEYEVYRPSPGTRRMISERYRKIFPEAFIESGRLGPLSELCVRSLAKLGPRRISPHVKKNKRFLRIFYETLDVNTPLKDCYFVDDISFWRRVLMAKSNDPTLILKKLEDYDWRGAGISRKYVELVENCPAAYWPDVEMRKLALLVRNYVHSIHLSRLQSHNDAHYLRHINSEVELDATSDLSEPSEVSSDEQSTLESLSEEEEEPPPPPPPVKKVPRADPDGRVTIVPQAVEIIESESSEDSEAMELKRLQENEAMLRAASIARIDMLRHQARYERNEIRQKLRDLRQEKKLEHERRKAERALARMRPPIVKKVKKKEREPRGVFSIAVDPEPEDNEDKIGDTRNKDILLRRRKRYDYPHEDCHHINLSFIGCFDQLTSLTIEFLGPQMDFGYHKRHTRFSYDDITHLAKGVRNLEQLKIFRLRNSLMDNMKLILIVKALRNLEDLEVVDFGCDNLEDNCYLALNMLLDRKNMLKSLELEYNMLGKNAIDSIGNVLLTQSNENPEVTALEYLGLAHNLLPPEGLDDFIHKIVGTIHIQKLNLNGVALDADRMVSSVGYLLRNHKPLLHLDMAANALNHVCGKMLLCALETNHKIIHFDCRGCDLSKDQEYEADVIVRRNNYETVNTFLGDNSITEEMLVATVGARRHPIMKKIQSDIKTTKECLTYRPSFPPSYESLEVAPELVEIVEKEESVFNIWKQLARQSVGVAQSVHNTIFSESSESFVYNSNKFTIGEVREHLHMPGPGNRYYFFKNQKQ